MVGIASCQQEDIVRTQPSRSAPNLALGLECANGTEASLSSASSGAHAPPPLQVGHILSPRQTRFWFMEGCLPCVAQERLGLSALMLAVDKPAAKDLVACLLEHRADVTLKDKRNRYPLPVCFPFWFSFLGVRWLCDHCAVHETCIKGYGHLHVCAWG